nr:histidine kinase [Marinigracilibium pacificum]
MNNFRPFLNPRLVVKLLVYLAVLFVSTIIWIVQQAREREKIIQKQKNEQLSNELKLLKSQINPHFLFNALNNIYSMSVTNEQTTPEMILKLSEMLRYVLYETVEDRVRINKEVEYIQNYVDFQRLKDDEFQNIGFYSNIKNNELLIEPMLFIPFIENAFKHGNIHQDNGVVDIRLISTDNEIQFSIINSKPSTQLNKDKASGIGIRNVKERLNLLYPNSHKLEINDSDTSFSVNLDIKI